MIDLALFDELAELLRFVDYDYERFGEAVADRFGLTSELGPAPSTGGA